MSPLLAVLLLALAQQGTSETITFRVAAAGAAERQTVGTVSADLRVGHELDAAEARALGDAPFAWLKTKDGSFCSVIAEWQVATPRVLRLRWLEPPPGSETRLYLSQMAPIASMTLFDRVTDGQRDVFDVGSTRVRRIEEGRRQDADADRHVLLRHIRGYDAARHADTCRPYWHVFAGPEPLLLTKGLGGRYPHHRGLYCGWNKVERDGKSHDFWHCRGGETLRHVADIAECETLRHGHARLATRCEWVKGEETFVREETTLELWLPSGDGALAGVDKIVDVTLRLEAIGAAVRLGGDAHHAGLHFRAAIAADDNRARARFARSPGAVDEGNDVWASCDWVAYAFVLGDREAEVVLLDHPDNSRPSQLSTRDYGRIGFFRPLSLEPGKPVTLRARLVVLAPRAAAADQPATPSAELAARLWQDYTQPPRVTLERAR